MLMEDKVISIFCLIDDILKQMGYEENCKRRVKDSEVLTAAIVSAMYFYGHHERSIAYLKSTGLMPKMLDKSRFSRRIHKCWGLLYDVFICLGSYLKEFKCEMRYILDSFPVAVCDNMRISRSKMIKGEKWRGYTASMRRYFYGVKVQLLVSENGIPIQFHFVPGKTADVKGLERLIEGLPPEASIYGDSAYTNYKIEDSVKAEKALLLKIQRKGNTKRPDNAEQTEEKLKMRKRVETTISDIKKLFPRTIHAITFRGFLLKLICFICVEQLNHFFD
jgi:hypothetical protein